MNDENKQTANALDDLPSPTVVRKRTKTQVANEAHASYLADPSEPNLQAFREVLSAVAFGIAMHYSRLPDNWEESAANLAVEHCIAQVQRGKYQVREYKGRTLPFTAWAVPLLRRKITDAWRMVNRAEKRKLREEAKKTALAEQARRLETKRNYFEFAPPQIASVIEQLRPAQARLLELKARRPQLSSEQIAAKLSLSVPQLHNRWSRLRKKVAYLLTPKRVWLNRPAPRWYPGAPSYQSVAKIFR